MLKKLKAKYFKNVRFGIYQIFIKHFNLRTLRVKTCNHIEKVSIPEYIDGICHCYTKFMEDVSYLKSKPVILIDLENKEIAVHFILTDGYNKYDCGVNKDELETLRYFEFPKEIEKEIMKYGHPDKRLYIAKSMVCNAVSLKSSSCIRLWLWNRKDILDKIRYV